MAMVRDRENMRLERTRLFGRVRSLFVELGKRFHDRSLLESPADVFYLNVDEVLGFVEGTSTCTDLRGLAAMRRDEFAGYQEAETPADRFETRGMVYCANTFRRDGTDAGKQLIELDLTDRTVNLYEQGYDLALRVGPMIDSSLIARKLGESERILVAAPAYLKLYGHPESPEELSQHKCISFGEQRSGQSSWVLTKNRQSQRINFHSALRCDDMATNMRLVQSGAGITMIPAFVCKESLASGSLQHILTQWYGPTPEFYLVYTERELMPNRLRLLIEFLTERSRTEKWRLSMRHVQPKALL